MRPTSRVYNFNEFRLAFDRRMPFLSEIRHTEPLHKETLALIFVMGNYTGTAFTVAAWVLVACTMLAVTI